MRRVKSLSCFAIPAGMVLVLCCVSASYASLQEITGDYVPGEIIISFEPGVTEEVVEDLANEFNFSVIRKLRLRKHNKYLISIGDGQTEEEVINQLIQITDILHAERNAIFRIPERWGCWPEPIIDEGAGDQIDFEDLKNVIIDPGPFRPYRPIDFIELIPIYPLVLIEFNGDSRVYLEPSFSLDGVSSSGESYVANPEPTTVLLLGVGALVMRRRKRG